MKFLKKYYLWLIALFVSVWFFILSKQKSKVVAMSTDSNIDAFLKMLRHCEGTSGENGYRTLFGGKLFDSYSSHPNKKVPFYNKAKGKNDYSTAAGAYQFLYSTWLEKKAKLLLPDFSPKSQDLAAIDILREKGALDFIKNGDLPRAIEKVKKVWASLPGAGYQQPEKTLAKCIEYFKLNGGQILV